MRVSLVGTVHAESGLANVGALQAIHERSQPDVIFAEIPASHVDRYKDGSHGSLESITVARYLASHHVDVEPVDLAKPEQKFFDDTKDMFRAVERTSPDYRRLVDRHSVETRAGGFPYLNSDRCIQAWADIYHELLATIEWTGDRRLRELYDLWSQTNERRDREMMRNIALYSARNAVARGIFLVGAAHRKSIIDKSSAGSGTGLPPIEWDLGGFLG
ncbi:MAG TPA: hypothetical protein DCZ01_03705 [Elusimicrobia bacterium]|nr:MAG: hypothetical protein A2X37_05960 [Elusimicrobia bacterium GWA2_66_18]OGR70625.1 MAG: hypothetical protein A2X40_07640 [Elusimicrobia bacterium GWC2_65_9]HAZ07633.1 hypothetical protein [Elusimicrobiota bacterium]